jgi:hypothetical protein
MKIISVNLSTFYNNLLWVFAEKFHVLSSVQPHIILDVIRLAFDGQHSILLGT